MMTVSIAELRQNPTPALDAVEEGATVRVTRYRKEIARLVPPPRPKLVTPDQFYEILRRTPLPDNSWAEELASDRAAFDAEVRDPWIS